MESGGKEAGSEERCARRRQWRKQTMLDQVSGRVEVDVHTLNMQKASVRAGRQSRIRELARACLEKEWDVVLLTKLRRTGVATSGSEMEGEQWWSSIRCPQLSCCVEGGLIDGGKMESAAGRRGEWPQSLWQDSG